jgi:hypothetical protein
MLGISPRWPRPPGASAYDDRGVVLPGVKVFPPGREHPLRTQFAKFSLLRGAGSEKQISMAPTSNPVRDN